MPDQSDVEEGLASFISGALYPNGVGAASALGTVCRVYRGLPVVGALEEDLGQGIVHVTVLPVAGSLRTTTRYPVGWVGGAPRCPLVAEVSGDAVRFSGTAGAGMVAGVLVDGRAYAWRVTAGCSPEIVAAVLADMVRVDRPAALSGATVRFADGRGVVGRAVSDGQGGQELRRQEGRFRVSLWCPTPGVRDAVAAFVDLALAGVGFLDVGGWGCRVRASGGVTHDESGVVRVWRRELVYRVEYPTVLEEALPAMLFGSGTVNGAGYFV